MIRLAAIALACLFGTAAFGQTVQVSPSKLTFNVAAGSIPQPQTFTVTTNPAGFSYSIGSSSELLSVSTLSGVTPATIAVTPNTALLTPGSRHTLGLFIRVPGAVEQLLIVELNVGFGSQLTASQPGLAFSYQAGSPAIPQTQSVTIASLTGFPLSFTAASSAPWLTVNPANGNTSTANLLVAGVSPQDLNEGAYNATITVTPQAIPDAVPLQIPVTFTIGGAPQLNVSRSSLLFNYQSGIRATAPAPQTISFTSSTDTQIPFSIVRGPATWLVLTAVNGFTPAELSLSVNPAGLPPGNYIETLTISAPGASNPTQNVTVTLRVSNSPLLNTSPVSLSFTYQSGGALPAAQTITVTSTTPSTPLGFSSAFTPASGGQWLTLTTATATTPGSILAGLNGPVVSGLLPGTYSGTVAVTGAGGDITNIPVSLKVTNDPVLTSTPTGLTFVYQRGKSLPAGQFVDVRSTGIPLTFTASAASADQWLTVVPLTAATTPAQIFVSVNPAQLTAKEYDGSITLSPQSTGIAAVTIPVKLIVSDTPLLRISPTELIFTLGAEGGSLLETQLISLESTDPAAPLQYNVSGAPTTGTNWLSIGLPVSGSTPNNVRVTVNATGLSAGTYTGSVTIAATGANTQTVPVRLIISSGTVTVSPALLSFTQASGGAAPPSQKISVESSGGNLGFTATPRASAGNWLKVEPTSGTTPASLTVTSDGAGLSPGTYSGDITIQTAGSSTPRIVPVTLTVTQAQSITVEKKSLAFNYSVGGSAPAAQTVAISGSGQNMSFTTAASMTSGTGWLAATPATGTLPGTVTVTVNVSGLAVGTYNGRVRVSSPEASNSPQDIEVSLVVSAGLPSPVAVVNAASFAPSAIAPGEIVTVFGTNIGPPTLTPLKITNGLVDTELAETRVLFDGIPAPLIYVRNDQLSAVVPYALTGRFSTRMQVEYRGVRSEAIELRVADTAPGIFTFTVSGSGQGAILNQNYSDNGMAAPAARGSEVMIYLTGAGQTTPLGAEAAIAPAAGAQKRVNAEVRVIIGGRQAEVTYAGTAPGNTSGLTQVNAKIPTDVQPGNAVPVQVIIGGISSQSGVTMAVQ